MFRYIATSSSETGPRVDSAMSLKALQGIWGPKKRKQTFSLSVEFDSQSKIMIKSIALGTETTPCVKVENNKQHSWIKFISSNLHCFVR